MAFDRNEAADVAFGHRPVLLDECMEGLAIRPGGIYLDGTLGRAGHSWEIVRRLNAGGRLIGLDRDETALEAARQRLAPYADRVTLVHSNFSRVAEVLDELGIPAADGMLFDLGVSSPQLDDAQRGFSYMHDAPLDMRMDRTAGLTARTVVNEWSYEELRRILYEYGEERYAPQIAAAIERVREKAEAFSSRSAQDDLLALPKGDKSKYVLQTLEYIAAHYADADINITTIARSIGISEGHLSHVFKKETSYTALGYLTLYRIHMARRLLADCRYKVYEVAGMVGYRDVAYFGSTFKKLTGLSPSEYQDRCR